MNSQITHDQATDSRWKSLIKAGGASALIIAALLLIEMIAYIATLRPIWQMQLAGSTCCIPTGSSDLSTLASWSFMAWSFLYPCSSPSMLS